MKNKSFNLAALISIGFVALMSATSAQAAGLDIMVNGAHTFLLSAAKLLNVLAAFVGGWFIFNGIMTWKKAGNEHGQPIEFKAVVLPIIAGVMLVAFTGFIMMTSTTLGFATANTAMFQ